MCGICGAIDLTNPGGAQALVQRMTPTMSHRGPDDEGYLHSEPVSLGMRRLSIIDLAGGHQPIFNETGSIGVILNGEIYNFHELRTQLSDRGHSFRTRSDSEVVAHAYEEWEEECVDHLHGMFAFAVYDRRTSGKGSDGEAGGRLFLARDRLGIKPLYYFVDERRLLFASEVRTLVASDVVARRLSVPALESYLLFGSVGEPMTLVEGILSLPPAHTMSVVLNGTTLRATPQPYWGPATAFSNEDFSKQPPVNPAIRVRHLLEESVRSHLTADVPVGVFLSSGIDSTSLAALASREVERLHTFTVAFPEAEFSEAAIARRTADTLGSLHQELMLSGDDMLARVDEALAALDQPSVDGINTYFVSWGARQAGLSVALSGLGSDEVFGGYSTFRRTPYYEKLSALGARMPGRLRELTAGVLTTTGASTLGDDAAHKLAALWDSSESLPHPYFFGRTLFTPGQVTALMPNGKTGSHDPLWWNWLAASVEETEGRDGFTAVSWMETRSYLVNTLLRDTDSMSMAHSLEVRVPFLDHLLVEFVASLPEALKRPNGTQKGLLVSALQDLLPAEVIAQPKRGFTFPWASWLRGPLKNSVANGLLELSPVLQDALDRKVTESVWGSYLNGRTSWSRPWSLYVLNEWTRRHLG
jgi:asparagine synthase (glutamine-hydrolysing)